MKRSVDRYFEGYVKKKVPRKNGKGEKTVYIYEGDYYRHKLSDKAWKARKVIYTAITVAFIAVFLFVTVRNTESNRVTYVAYPALFTLIPLILMVAGCFSGIIAKRDMTVREYRNYGIRFMYSSAAAAILMLVSFVGEIVFMITNSATYSSEWISLAGYFICVCLGAAAFVLERCTSYDIKEGKGHE